MPSSAHTALKWFFRIASFACGVLLVLFGAFYYLLGQCSGGGESCITSLDEKNQILANTTLLLLIGVILIALPFAHKFWKILVLSFAIIVTTMVAIHFFI